MSDAWDRIKARKRQNTAAVSLCLDPSLLDAVRDAEAAVNAGVRGAKTRLVDAEKARDDATETFRFRALPMAEYRALIEEHPPSDDALAEAERTKTAPPDFDLSTFAPALVAASMIEPDLTGDEITEMWASPEWAYGDLMVLFATANALCGSSNVVALGKGSAGIGG